jgi:uncharacterized protein (UPF0335 family)
MTNTDTDIKSLARRIEALMVEKEARAADIAEVYLEAKSGGHNVRGLRAAIKRKRADQAALREHEEWLKRYCEELGVLV